jgi:putative transposase
VAEVPGTVLDEYTRECLAIHCAHFITASRVVRVLPRLCSQCGTPGCLKSANGAEFVAVQVAGWLSEQGVPPHVIEPGSPGRNAHNESFNSMLRDGCLDR